MKIFVAGSIDYGAPFSDYGQISCNTKDFLNNPKSFGLLVFTGGNDVDPNLYGHKRNQYCGATSPARDHPWTIWILVGL